MNAPFALAPAATPAPLSCADLAQRIASLLLEREANQKALRAARARFNPPPRPAELTVTYRGPFGSIAVDVDGEDLREMLPEFSPRSRCGRRLRRLLRLHDEHEARFRAERLASGAAAAMDERSRIESELMAAAEAACRLGVDNAGDLALHAAATLATKLGSYQDGKRAPAIRPRLLGVIAKDAERVLAQDEEAAR